MANNIRGKRGGSKFNKSVKRDVQSMLNTGSTSDVVANGKSGYTPAMNPYWDGEETVDDYLKPRRSLTIKQGLEYKPLKMEFEDRSGRQLDKVSKRLVAVTDRRLVWKSDRTLLVGGKVDDPYKTFTGIKRVTSRSKRIVHDQPTPRPMEGKTEISLNGKHPIIDDDI